MKPIDTFQNRLNRALTLRNIKPVVLHEKTGISESLISKYLSGNAIARQKKLSLISDALDVSPVWLLGYDVPISTEINRISDTMFMVPVYGQISAGQPNWAVECLEGYLPIDPTLMNILNPEETFFLKVNGESMNKVIKNGSYALIRKQEIVENGEIAVVLVNNNDATLKHFSQNGQIVILSPDSDLDEFEPIPIDLKTTTIKILGKYIGKFEINN